MTQRVLGLDLGVASVGWCLLEPENEAVCASGARAFELAIEPKGGTPKNVKRRTARGARRTVRRRQMRRDALAGILREQGMLPTDPQEFAALFSDHAQNPYALRARGLDEKLTLIELGRALYHLNRRRGFKSNRGTRLGDLANDPEIAAIIAADAKEKAARAAEKRKKNGDDEPEEDKEEGVVLAEIAALRGEMRAAGSRTLGEHFAKLLATTDEDRCLAFTPVRRRYTERAMYEEEFDALWTAQAAHHPNVLTDGLKARVHQAIFHQRPLKIQRGLVGKCQYEKARPRCDKAHPDAQEFRIWQLLAHLSYRPVEEFEWRLLDQSQRDALAKLLSTTAMVTWAGFRKELNLPKGVVFSHEGKPGHDKGVAGNTTLIRIEKAAPGLWDHPAREKSKALEPHEVFEGREALIEALFTIHRKDSLVRRLGSKWGLTTEQAYKLAVTEFDDGVANLSLQAIRNILPHLKSGKNYHDAVRAAALEIREGKGPHKEPRPNKADLYLHAYEKESETLDSLPLDRLPTARNPVVDKCLHEVRKLVNAIIREHGKPAIVRIELARSLKLNKKDKKKLEDENKRIARLNEVADKVFEEIKGGVATRTDRIKYRLWKESLVGDSNEANCPYTGERIGLARLYGGDVDVEHIIPFSRCLDDSFANKTLCIAKENRERKKNRTPYEAYNGTEQYEQILQRVDAMKCGRHKKRLFRLTPEEVQELYKDLASRHLNDTRYIAVLAKDYLKLLGVEVEVGNGKATAALRHRWGLNTILAPGDLEDEARAEKNRMDHRHHAVDAAVIAATSRAYLKRLSDANKKLEEDETTGKRQKLGDAKWHAPPPWEGFRDAVASSVRSIVVSHQATRGLSGALHDETAYGWDPKAGKFTVRKPVSMLSDPEVQSIRDAKLRERVIAHRAEVAALLAEHKEKKEANEKVEKFVEPELWFQDRHGKQRIVRRVKVNTKLTEPSKMLKVEMKPSEKIPVEPDPRATKSLPFGSNHHFVIYYDQLSSRVQVEVVTMHEAARRAVRGQPIFAPTLTSERLTPVMALCTNDIVEVEGRSERYYRVVKFSTPGTDKRGHSRIDLALQPLTDARSFDYNLDGHVRWTSTDHLRAIERRVLVDRLGRIIPGSVRF
ncbi:MAG: type II CRISPR RNA-guided endonuclease Cas9 [Fimbriimonadaceae bacterium]|nr:type II CRISPR RNA-guided endonuclease Cas9 [Fimbriimonadaceae bacterium]